MAKQEIEDLGNPDSTEINNLLHGLALKYLNVAGIPQDKVNRFMASLADFDTWNTQYVDQTGINPGMDVWDGVRCLVDTVRTKALLGGIRESCSYLRQNQPGSLVGIDAGTGTGILSLALIAGGFDKVFALEINPQTAEATKAFIKELGVQGKIEITQCDATSIDLGSLRANLLISENLSNALMDEPQYEIIWHLSKFIRHDAHVLPYGAQLFVSLGSSNWQRTDRKEGDIIDHVAARKLLDLTKLTDREAYAWYKSYPGLNLTRVSGRALLNHTQHPQEANTLILSTRFAINPTGKQYFIEPDSAEFLGKSRAYKIGESLKPDYYDVSLDYPTGVRCRYAQISVNGNRIQFNAEPPK